MNPGDTIFVPLALFGILPLGLLFDALLPRHRSILATLLAGFLFLPSAEYQVGGAFDWNRTTATMTVILLGVAMRDLGLLMRFRLRWWDLPVVCWCMAPGLSSLSNGFPLQDAISAAFYMTMWIGVPYFLGRLHFSSRAQLIDLAGAIVLGCLIYVPLCWYEIRMSPTLHMDLYGFSQHRFNQTIRGNYYRPMVFLQHGLMAAMWMAMGALIAGSLAMAFKGAKFLLFPLAWLAAGMALTLVAMQSLGAFALSLLAWSMLFYCRRTGANWPLLALALLPTIWCGLRASGTLPSASIVSIAAKVSAERAESLAFRLETEDDLAHHVRQRPLFGWGTWGRDRVVEQEYQERTLVLDGHWIIRLSQNGFLGLLSLLAAHLLPLLIVFHKVKAASWRSDGHAQVLGCLGIVLAMSMVDNLINSMINPFFILIMGAIPTIALALQEAESVPADVLPKNVPASSGPRVLGA